jgi:DEAD/DEAH box helicase domain-containing protein
MLPSVLAKKLQQGLSDYIETTFPMTNPFFKGSLRHMLETDDSVFHKPYVAVRLPFRVAEDAREVFQAVHPQFKPYVHQQKAYERLASVSPRSTLIATGTGSGKTECFLFPILEYCYQHIGEPGIKAIIIYPMNALASDQAKRFAEEIHKSPELKSNVTVGMYVGGYEKTPNFRMLEHEVITDHETLRSSPPDILLTNYKMLDYLLIRPKDSALWIDNKPETLKFIAVDELHTFDGAQGTDLACLLRRLKARLSIPEGHLCCIGTSATMGTKDTSDEIRKYAERIFGEPFEADSVITEDRLSSSEFFSGFNTDDFTIPDDTGIQALIDCIDNDDLSRYLLKATQCWLNKPIDITSDEGRVTLGKALMTHSFTQSMITLMGGNYLQVSNIIDELGTKYPQLAKLRNPEAAIDALISLISHARIYSADKLRPFLTVQVQLWIRELRRLVATVSKDEITYALATDLNEHQAKHYLPVVNCRDCGETGWTSLASERGNLTMTNLDAFYNLYFRADGKVIMVFPHEHNQASAYLLPARLCPNCLQLHPSESAPGQCTICGSKMIDVLYTSKLDTHGPQDHKQYTCPFCDSRRGLSIVGLRSATEISVSLSQLFSSKFNNDKKTLAFSDNVQDAAHRAGFFNSRTWRFGFRSAMQRYAMNGGDGQSLAAFSKGFTEYWRKKLTPEEFVSSFIPPNMIWMNAYEDMLKNGKLDTGTQGGKLLQDIECRTEYEIMLEYGLAGRTGRTLEKSGCSTLTFDLQQINAVASKVRQRSINELGLSREIDLITFERMVLGFANIMRMNGAFNDPVFYGFTRSNATDRNRMWQLSSDHYHWLPGLQSGRNTPRFIYEPATGGRVPNSFDSVKSPKYVLWIKDCIGQLFVDTEVCAEISKFILSELFRSNIIVSMPSGPNFTVWALNKNSMRVTTDVAQLVCNKCGNTLSVATENVGIWENAPCLRSKCYGHFQMNPDVSLGYYAKLYSDGDLDRIIAKEHTGLFEREEREELEHIFKRKKDNGRMPWDTNVLSCTPTLEMGIDIGDLSTIVLCNIPPTQAQFTQRTGRAGRKDGNALSLVVANARPHDLYFYADPLDMISGVTDPPAVFLRASAVLERQFVAYCMDCWIKDRALDKAIPKTLDTCLSKLESADTEVFPHNYLTYVQTNLTMLMDKFIGMFSSDLDNGTKEELRQFAEGNGLSESPMYVKVHDAFARLKKHRDALKANVKQLTTLIKELEKRPKDSSYETDIKELKMERAALSDVIKSINNKDIFNFLSDEGLLPNYAFPEAGIVLKAILRRQLDDKGQPKKAVKTIYEYQRPAVSAISEFAPNNSFYVNGRKLKINQIDLTTAQTELWRLCPNCSHAQLEVYGQNVAACPQCGSPAWADAGQIRKMLKVQMVYSHEDYEKSFSFDESEDRSSRFYCKQMLVDVDENKDIIKAYSMSNNEFKFGYEFVKKAIMREINFGESDIVGEKLTIAGVEEVRKGFRVCKYCGIIQPEHGEPKHALTCRSRNITVQSEDPIENCLFLYREFTTEALRILVPATTMDSDSVRRESFTAAFMLGMKKYFGNVDHLRACISEVPAREAGNDYRKLYLVIYDSVPGGTGYLKQLMQNKNSFIEILQKALEVLENCSCKEDPQKDGCYHCLYAYRQSQKIGQISRRTAIRLLKVILSGKDSLEEISKLADIPVNSLFESELERQFIAALDRMRNNSRPLTITKELVRSKEGYRLQVGDCVWEIEPQVTLDSSYGVSIPTRADFIIWPVKGTKDQKPVAIYTDGFMYHKDSVVDDTLKREAIRRSNRFRVWVLSWKDVQAAFRLQGDYATNTLIPQRMPSGPKLYQPTISNYHAESLRPDIVSPIELLMNYLEMPYAEEIFRVHSRAYAMSLLDIKYTGNQTLFNEWHSMIHPMLYELSLDDTKFVFHDTIFGKWTPGSSGSLLSILTGVSTEDMQKNGVSASYYVFSILNDLVSDRNDKYEADWNGFWHFFNVMQFLHGFVAVSKLGIERSVYRSLPMPSEITEVPAVTGIVSDDRWNEVLSQLFDDAAKNMATKLIALGIPAPSVVGFELLDEVDAVIAEAEMAWEEQKIVYLLPDSIGQEAFLRNRWLIITTDTELTKEMFERRSDE